MWAEGREVLRCYRCVGRGQGGVELLEVCGAEGRELLRCCRCVGRRQGGVEVLRVCGHRRRRC